VEREIEIMVETAGGIRTIPYKFGCLFCAGYTGRDPEKAWQHINELRDLGVPPPPAIPTIYRVGLDRLVFEKTIEVQGGKSSGEVEFVLLVDKNNIYVTIGSDHTDRELEKLDIPKAKQISNKVCPNHFWEYSTVRERWDSITIQCWAKRNGEKVLYQSGNVSQILSPEKILAEVRERVPQPLGNYMVFSGTMAGIDGLYESSHYWLRMTDPVMKRNIEFDYAVEAIEGTY